MSLRSVWCHDNHENAHASDATIIITFDSQAHVIQVHEYCTKWETFRFALPAWNLFTQDDKSKAWSHLSGGPVFGKIRVLTKSRNRCKLSLFRFHYSASVFYFCTFPSILRRLSSESFNRDSRLRQTANVNLYHMTKFPPYFQFTLYCFYTKISQFYASCNHRNRTGLFFICLIWFWEILNLSLTFAVCRLR